MPPFCQVEKTLAGGQQYKTQVVSLLLPWFPFLENQGNAAKHILYFGKNYICQLVVQHKGLKSDTDRTSFLSEMLNVNFRINGE